MTTTIKTQLPPKNNTASFRCLITASDPNTAAITGFVGDECVYMPNGSTAHLYICTAPHTWVAVSF